MRTSSFILPAIVTLALVGCGGAKTDSNSSSSSAATSNSATLSSTPTMTSSEAAPTPNSAWDGKMLTGKHTVIVKTDKGEITLELDADAAPKTVTNFIVLAKSGFYNGLTFHRVIPGFMIQGGDPNGNGTGGASIYGPTFDDEIVADSPLYKTGYKAGVIAMANRGMNTNGSQFFIMDKDYPLPPNYTIFGHVTSGQATVSNIANTPRDPNDAPKTPVKFTVDVKN